MKKQKKGGLLRKIGRCLLKIVLSLLLISVVLTVLYRWVNPPITPLMVIRKITIGAPIKKEWKPLSDISPYMVRCAVAAEDNNFLGHSGFDWIAIDRAIEERRTRHRKRGASTISQQTAKNVFLWPNSSWIRKGCEVYFTFLIETCWSKERIMEVYLNVIEMGKGIYGAEAAAQHYFHKSAKNLSLRQAALITACYPAPLKRNPAKATPYLNKRASQISNLTTKIGRIRFDDATIANARARYQKREQQRKNQQH